MINSTILVTAIVLAGPPLLGLATRKPVGKPQFVITRRSSGAVVCQNGQLQTSAMTIAGKGTMTTCYSTSIAEHLEQRRMGKRL